MTRNKLMQKYEQMFYYNLVNCITCRHVMHAKATATHSWHALLVHVIAI